MKNRYTIIDNYVVIHMKARKGIEYNTLIDLEDLPKLLDFNIRWFSNFNRDNKSYYARACEYQGMVDGKPKYKSYYLQKYIIECDYEIQKNCVDHINHDTLDNRKNNLRVSFMNENLKNRKGKNSNNTSGYRNVSKVQGMWYVQMQVDGKNTRLKSFPLDQLEEAGAYAELMRPVYYGQFAGNS